MIKHFLLSTTITLSLMGPGLQSVSQTILWDETYGGSGADGANEIITLPGGGLAYIGYAGIADGDVDEAFGDGDIWMMVTNAENETVWENTYGGSGNETGLDILATDDGGYLICGNTLSSDGDMDLNYGFADGWVARLDGEGNVLWSIMIGGSLNDYVRSMVQTEDGGFLVCGATASTDGLFGGDSYGGYDLALIKLTAEGEMDWFLPYGGSGDDGAEAIITDIDGTYHIFGYSSSSDGIVEENNGGYDAWHLHVEADGSVIDQEVYGGSSAETFLGGMVVSDGMVMVGSTLSIDGDVSGGHGGSDMWVVHSVAGNLDWQLCIGGDDFDLGKYIEPYGDNYMIMGDGTSNSDDFIDLSHGGSDFMAAVVTVEGDLEWTGTFGGDANEFLYGAVKTPEGDILLCGESSSDNGDVNDNNGQGDAWIIQLGLAIGVANHIIDMTGFILFPNPASGSTSVVFHEQKDVQAVSLVNGLGQVIFNQTGYGRCDRITIDLKSLAEGYYFVQVEFKDGTKYMQEIMKSGF